MRKTSVARCTDVLVHSELKPILYCGKLTLNRNHKCIVYVVPSVLLVHGLHTHMIAMSMCPWSWLNGSTARAWWLRQAAWQAQY